MIRKAPLHVQILIGLLFGVVWALLSSIFGWSAFTMKWIAPFGEIFIRLLKLIAVPLVLFSIIQGISGLSDLKRLGRIGLKTLLLYLGSTVMAITVGLLLVNVFAPGKQMDEAQRRDNRIQYEIWVSQTPGVEIKDGKSLLAEENGQGKGSVQDDDPDIQEKISAVKARKESGPLQFFVDLVPSNIFESISDNRLMLQVIFFAIFFGVTLVALPNETTGPITTFVDSITAVFLKMVHLVMKGAPFFVFALLAGQIAKMAGNDAGKVLELFLSLGRYVLVVIVGLAFMIFAFYPTIGQLLIKPMNYKKFFRGISPAQFLAFSSSSSAATLPVTMECVNENLGASKEITSFVLPVGATVNMDGTSLYQAVAVVFLAQIHMVDLSLGQQLTIVLTATLASIGSAAVPSAGLIMLIIVLQSVGLNPAWIAIIFPVDRLLDMCRTVVNVTGDATVASLVAYSENELDPNPIGLQNQDD